MTNTPLSSSLQAMLATIKVDFMRTLPEHLAAFQAYLADPELAKKQAAQQDISMRAHRLAGVCATMGLAEMGETALQLEAVIAQRNSAETRREMVAKLVAQIETALASE
jgi:HPt (histidine-containing phosphotransfer) domain-containing protein